MTIRLTLIMNLVVPWKKWSHHNTPEMKVQSIQWISPGEHVSKKAKMVLRRKGYDNNFLGLEWHNFYRLLGKKKNDNRTTLHFFIGSILYWLEEKLFPFGEEKIIFHHDNAPLHTSVIDMAKNPQYSSDLAHRDSTLLPNVKKWPGGKIFTSNNEVIT